MTRYHDVAQQVVDKTELLTDLINACSKVQCAAARLIELENDIHIDPKHVDTQKYNVNRDMVKRVAVLEEALRALEFMSDQQTDSRLIKAAQLAGLDKLMKLERWHPEIKEVMHKRLNGAPEETVGDTIKRSPYTDANMEDFDDE